MVCFRRGGAERPVAASYYRINVRECQYIFCEFAPRKKAAREVKRVKMKAGWAALALLTALLLLGRSASPEAVSDAFFRRLFRREEARAAFGLTEEEARAVFLSEGEEAVPVERETGAARLA